MPSRGWNRKITAINIGTQFANQCDLTPEQYQQQPLIVKNNKPVFERDNRAERRIHEYRSNGSAITGNETFAESLDTDDPNKEKEDVNKAEIKRDLSPESKTEINTPTTDPLGKNKTASISAVAPQSFFPAQSEPSSMPEAEYQAIIANLHKVTQEYKDGLSPKHEKIHGIINKLHEVLSSEKTNDIKIKNYFNILENADGQGLTNMQIIQNNQDIPTGRFLAGIAAIALTLATGILPGLAVMGVVYCLTGKTPRDLFKARGHLFAQKVYAIESASATFNNQR